MGKKNKKKQTEPEVNPIDAFKELINSNTGKLGALKVRAGKVHKAFEAVLVFLWKERSRLQSAIDYLQNELMSVEKRKSKPAKLNAAKRRAEATAKGLRNKVKDLQKRIRILKMKLGEDIEDKVDLSKRKGCLARLFGR